MPNTVSAPRHTAAWSPRSHALVVTAALMVLAGGCSQPPPQEPAAPGPAATARLADDALVVGWSPIDGHNGMYEVQASTSTGWVTFEQTALTSASYSDVQNRRTYSFRVRAAATGSTPPTDWGPVTSALYVDLVLPVMWIDTGGAPIADKENYVPGSVQLDPNGSGYSPYSGTMGIRGRGNSTWTYPKKPYRLKLDTRSELMGMASERDWVLLANYIERSHLRTAVAMEASAATDLEYTPTTRHVEVVLNGRYDGVYVLTQHNEVGPDRIDIDSMGPGDVAGDAVTGGYLLELDFHLGESDEPGFRTAANVPIVVKDPDPMAAQQLTYIRSRVQAFENALLGAAFTNPSTGYRAYLDVETFIDHYLVQELTRNQDAFHSSTFFTKQRGDALFRFGPVWDFDRSIGTNGGAPTPATGWWVRTGGTPQHPWVPRLFEDPMFVQQVVQRWDELKPAFLQVVSGIPARGAALQPAVDNDAARWNYPIVHGDRPEFLVAWLQQRIAWMDAQLHA